jgi:hypothetical protein
VRDGKNKNGNGNTIPVDLVSFGFDKQIRGGLIDYWILDKNGRFSGSHWKCSSCF